MTDDLPHPTPSPLGELLASSDVAIELLATEGDVSVPIDHLTHDSRAVRPGTLFTAYRGVNLDVHRFLPDAFARGAAAALVEREPAELLAAFDLPAGVTLVQVPDVRRARAAVAAALYGKPGDDLALIGVTGTDGKTTTSTLIHALLEAGGIRTGLISTVAARIGTRALDTGLHVTTPEPEDVQRYLRAMVDDGCSAAVLEATSHGLAQHRLGSLGFDVAVFTNITHEAIEYHRSFEAYREAKAMLLRALRPSATSTRTPTAILNADDPSFSVLSAVPVPRRWSYGREPDSNADFRARDEEHGAAGLLFTATTPVGDVAIESSLVGSYNVSNILAALAAAHAMGVPPSAWRDGVAQVRGIPGRMERIDQGQGFMAVVDFAHTPNALASSLAAARPLVAPGGRVIAVFGCAGLRDPSKRIPMGEAAARHADLTIITAEDPRTEDLAAIMAQVAEGLHRGGAPFELWPDRAAAIARACDVAGAGDIVLVLGKGHEQSMCFGDVEYPWDDRRALRAVLRGEALPFSLPTAGHGMERGSSNEGEDGMASESSGDIATLVSEETHLGGAAEEGYADGVARHPHPDNVRLERWMGQLSTAFIGGLLSIPTVVIIVLSRPGVGPELPAWLGTLAALVWIAIIALLAIFHHRWPAIAHEYTTYALDERGLEIKRGVLFRREINVPASRIQHTDVRQGPLERRLGLATLVVHTAGTRHAAVGLNGLDEPRARAMRDHLAAVLADDDAV